MTSDPRSTYSAISGLAIGFTIVFGMLIAYPLTGGAFNPARAFGPPERDEPQSGNTPR